MIYLVENATRKKTPNEIALFTLLMTLTIVFSCHFNNVSFSDILHFNLSIAMLIALTVCLIQQRLVAYYLPLESRVWIALHNLIF